MIPYTSKTSPVLADITQKVLLLLDEFQERGKHLVVIDDNYDSMEPADDTIGIKTWFNERYVKDTSKKIKRAIGAKQKRRCTADKTAVWVSA